MKATKYFVISYDNDEQQTFYDDVLAADGDKAKEFVELVRPYAIAVAAMSAQELLETGRSMISEPEMDISRLMKAAVREMVEANT